jgi:protein-L-isoaspartate(D-aspartate) O-methyltransferase
MVATQVRARGVVDPSVLGALETVPRHLFVPRSFRHRSHDDAALPIPAGQTISQPFMVGLMTEALEVYPGLRVLEIGTGTGYQTAVLSTLGARVYTIERIPGLSRSARRRLEALGLDRRVRFRVGDGTVGWPEESPFGGILVTAGAPRVPRGVLATLARGGRLVIPVGGHGAQELIRIRRSASGELSEETLCRCAFVPLVGEEGWPDPDA